MVVTLETSQKQTVENYLGADAGFILKCTNFQVLLQRACR